MPGDEPGWSAWEPLGLHHHFTHESLRESLDGGQAFRWSWIEHDNAWRGIFGEHVVELQLTPDRTLCTRAATDHRQAISALRDYLGMAAVLKEALAQMPLSSDSVLANAVAGCPGLIILRQPLEETLLAFLLSSNKRIPQIRQMCEALAFRHGALLAHGLHALPTWETLASVSKDALRRCSLGFRARHVHGTARFLAAHPGWLDRVRSAPYSDAHALLLELPGVGDKIADCVLLFAGGKPEAFPVDVWILRALENNYGLHGWKPAQLAQFGRVHFGPFAGLAQQHLFAAERRRR